jgi:hypothetical protein
MFHLKLKFPLYLEKSLTNSPYSMVHPRQMTSSSDEPLQEGQTSPYARQHQWNNTTSITTK